MVVDRVAGLRAVASLPVLGEKRLELRDLLGEIVRGAAGERRLVPHHRRGRGNGVRRQPRRLGVVHVGHDQHRRRMLVEAVDHLAQRQAHILQADLLADDVEGHGGKAAVHLAHHARQHGAVAHAGVEQPHRGRLGMDVSELEPDAARHHVLLAAGIHEQQVLLPVVEEAEVLLRRQRFARRRRGGLHGARADQRQQLGRRIARAGEPVPGDELVDPLQSLWRDARAVAQPRDELAVVHRAPAEGGFSHAGAPAEIRNASEQRAAGLDDLLHPAQDVGRGKVGLQPHAVQRKTWDISHY